MHKCKGNCVLNLKTTGKLICFSFKDLLPALVALGLNIMEQEVVDMTNTLAKNGLVYFPEFCRVVLAKFREDDDEQFAQVMFKVGGAETPAYK